MISILLLSVFTLPAWGMPIDIPGQWYDIGANPSQARAEAVSEVNLTGGHYRFEGTFTLADGGRYVLDFKNTSSIGRFHQQIFNAQGQRVADLRGGITAPETNPFFLRHGRELTLPAGRYRLVSEMDSAFYLAQPEPYLDTLAHYRQAIKPGNALALAGLGIFLGLGVYYAALAVSRRRLAESMYSLFILGNLLYNGTSLLVFSELFGLRNLYLLSVPILFSNMAYIVFVMALLEIRPPRNPRLFYGGLATLSIMAILMLWGLFAPGSSLQMARYGVALFLLFGMFAGLVRSVQGSMTARLYLVAVSLFFILGGLAITRARLSGVYAITIEHLGLLAVVVEVMLLALVLAYQFARLHREKEIMHQHLVLSRRLAHTDVLTGLPNRYIMDQDLEVLPERGSLTFIDLDRLKYYNDHYGHARGDELLSQFAAHMERLLAERAKIYRLGGDEFAITCPEGDIAWVERILEQGIADIRDSGFEFAGASAGSVRRGEVDTLTALKHLADMRMYQSKQKKSLA